MEITTPSLTNDAVVAVAAKSPPDQPDPKRTNTKSLSFTNGVLKRHHIVGSTPPSSSSSVDVVVVEYKECLKNHAAALGGHALDGCGEFMPDRSASSNPNLSISLKCAVCGCHRNFHRREPEDSPTALPLLTPPPNPAIEFHPHHHHRNPPLPLTSALPTSPSPPPISSSYYHSSAPHMLLALSTGLPPPENTQHQTVAVNQVSGSGGRKRFRTKFSSLQKEKMHEVAEKVGWKMQKKDDEIVNELCNRIGVGREVFKVWMHNNKTTFNFNNNKPSSQSAEGTGNADNNVFFGNGDGLSIHHDIGEFNTAEDHSLPCHSNLNAANGSNTDMIQHQQNHHHHHRHGHVTTNGSVSSP